MCFDGRNAAIVITLPPKPGSRRGLLLGLAGGAAVTTLFTGLVTLNASTVGFRFLLVVLGMATATGFRVSAVLSVVAMLCFSYLFLPPVGRFTIADWDNWVSPLAFLVTTLAASHLSESPTGRGALPGLSPQAPH